MQLLHQLHKTRYATFVAFRSRRFVEDEQKKFVFVWWKCHV